MAYLNEGGSLGSFIGATVGYIGSILTIINLYPNPTQEQENLFVSTIIISPLIVGAIGGVAGYYIKKNLNTNQKQNNLENKIDI